jgi:hypothetical protein
VVYSVAKAPQAFGRYPAVRVLSERPPAARPVPRRRWVLATAAMAALVGCVGVPTPYIEREPAMPEIGAVTISGGSAYGYRDSEISDRIMRVTFRGNPSTSVLRAADFALLRCAEVALEQGRPYFMIQERSDTSREFTSSTTFSGMPMTSCNDKRHCTTTYTQGTSTSQTWVYPNFEYIVELLSEPPEDETRFALDAEDVGRTIRTRYNIGVAPQ